MRCPRCSGSLFPQQDNYDGTILDCINCGYQCKPDLSPLTRLPTDREVNRQAKRNRGRPAGISMR